MASEDRLQRAGHEGATTNPPWGLGLPQLVDRLRGRRADLPALPDPATTATRLAIGLGLSASIVTAAARLLPGWEDLRGPGYVVDLFVGVFAALSVAMLVRHRRGWTLGRPAQYTLTMAATVSTAVGSYVAGGAEGVAIAVVFVLTTAMAVINFPAGWVLAHHALVAVSYGIVVVLSDGSPAQWLLVVGLSGSAGYLAGRLHNRTIRLAERFHATEQWRAALMSTLAHDLRSPLTTIQSTVELLDARMEHLSPEQSRELLAALRQQTDKALRLTSDLLEHERASAGRLALRWQTVDLRDLVEGVVAGVPSAGVDCDVPAGLRVRVDPARFEQVLVNLLTNAVRYGTAPIEVTATPGDTSDVVHVAVRDHGPGIPESARDQLFARFNQDVTDPESIGLGLWIVDHLARAHGAAVTYEDAAPGARFVLTLPTAADTAVTFPPGP